MNINDYQEDYQYSDNEGKTGWIEKMKQKAIKNAEKTFNPPHNQKYCLRCQGICHEVKE